MAKKLTIVGVKCVRPSLGIDSTAKTVFGVIAAAAVTATAVAAIKASGGLLLAIKYTAIGVGAATAYKNAGPILDVIGRHFSGSDELYIKVNGRKVWPSNDFYSIDSGHYVPVNTTIDLNNEARISLWERDGSNESSADFMGELVVDGGIAPAEIHYLLTDEKEGSIYELTLRVTA